MGSRVFKVIPLSQLGSVTCSRCPRRLCGCLYDFEVSDHDYPVVIKSKNYHEYIKNKNDEYVHPCMIKSFSQIKFHGIVLGGSFMFKGSDIGRFVNGE